MSETTKALFKDALYQVLDNKVFRIMTVLVVVLLLPTFLIAAKKDELVILFGAWEIPYGSMRGFLREMGVAGEPNVALMQWMQTLLVDYLAGTFGLMFVIAATAFFVPRMVEKGAADTIFSKPVSRTALLMSRYVAGIVFVALLSCVLVFGIHIGMWVNSGFADAGFLWAIPLMIYKYSVLHAFSLLVAVLSRNAVAALLTTLLFFGFNSCVHQVWYGKEVMQEMELNEALAGELEADEDTGAVVRAFLGTIDVLHYVLPKTGDAALIAQKLRKAFEDRNLALIDVESGLQVRDDPEGFEQVPVGPADLPVIGAWKRSEGVGKITLKRWPYAEKKRMQSLRDLDAELAARGIEDVEKEREHVFGANRSEGRRWIETRDGATVARQDMLTNGDRYLFALEYELPVGWQKDEPLVKQIEYFQDGLEQPGSATDRPDKFIERRASWTGELKYNLTFSVLSTLAFILVMLGLACWRLSRIDF